jgi:hypothetical protein
MNRENKLSTFLCAVCALISVMSGEQARAFIVQDAGHDSQRAAHESHTIERFCWVLTIAVLRAARRRDEAFALVMAQGVGADARLLGQFTRTKISFRTRPFGHQRIIDPGTDSKVKYFLRSACRCCICATPGVVVMRS